MCYKKKVKMMIFFKKKVEWERLCRAFGLTSGDEDALSDAPRLAKVN